MTDIIVKGISGNSYVFSGADFDNYEDLFRRIHEKDQPKTSVVAYARAVTLNAKGRRISLGAPFDKTLSYFTMMRKSWTFGRNFDDETLEAECPITLETVRDATNCQNCQTIFERAAFMKLNTCPYCRCVTVSTQ